eukprot:1172720-Alexandrium_andersonii.AAC.1
MGLPCQSTTTAGRGRAGADPRGLWSTAAQLIREVRPPVVVLEVAPGFWKGSRRGRFLVEVHGTPYAIFGRVMEAKRWTPQGRTRGG